MALKDCHHCIVPDLPEHGLSVDVGIFTVKGTADMISDIIRYKGLESKTKEIFIWKKNISPNFHLKLD
ncbi:MAG: alpha/beta fold hydrolase [Methanobacterium sp.]|jgi:hypothetical protein